jgi:glutamate 5-kinase
VTGVVETRIAGARLADAGRLVVKIGSILLVDADSGTLRADWLAALAADVARLRHGGVDVVLVSSGSIAVGRADLDVTRRNLKLEEKQAAAAVGQIRLAHAYQEALGRHGITVAQILLTPDDTEDRRRGLNARNTIETLLGLGAVPVINENDSVATDEIRFGDNDRLAARVAQMVSADALVLLSDIDGLYTADPRQAADAELVPEVTQITPAIEAMAGTAVRGNASGGMETKLSAARIAMAAGCRMVIADGKPEHGLAAIDDGARCTWFLPTAGPRTARKRWIASTVMAAGAIFVDDGAVAALHAGKSLLPVGVTKVEGDFERGDAIEIRTGEGRHIGKGLSAYSADNARLIAGHKSREIERLLGYRGRDELVHRDDLVLD